MGKHAASKTKAARITRTAHDDLMDQAEAAYRAEQLKLPKKRRGYRTICRDISAEHKCNTGTNIPLSYKTLERRVNGIPSLAKERTSRGWLKKEEIDIVIEYAIDCAKRGWPLSLARLKEHADKLLRSRLPPDQFPVGGVGRNWASRLVETEHKRLQMYNSRPLESVRGRAVNQTTHDAWFALLEDTVSGKYSNGARIDDDMIFSMDEGGFMRGCGQRERVIGPSSSHIQHQNRSGDRENITVIATICGDGTSQPPAVIYKSEHFMISWKQDNPLDAS
jgi:hypothetical protein